jgi:hypothetical protein
VTTAVMSLLAAARLETAFNISQKDGVSPIHWKISHKFSVLGYNRPRIPQLWPS